MQVLICVTYKWHIQSIIRFTGDTYGTGNNDGIYWNELWRCRFYRKRNSYLRLEQTVLKDLESQGNGQLELVIPNSVKGAFDGYDYNGPDPRNILKKY